MKNTELLRTANIILLVSLTTLCLAQPPVDVRIRFMERVSAIAGCEMEVYELVTDTSRIRKYTKWMENEPAHWAIGLYGEASRIMNANRKGTVEITAYWVALVPGGNEAAVGFCLRDSLGMKSFPHAPYIKLAPEDWAFSTTFLHETGHVVLSILNGGKEIPKGNLSCIPHSTAALTDRGTAFDEGFAIHLETLAARFSLDPVVRERYYHERYLFGIPSIQSEYHRQVADLLTFAQTRTRYSDVAENNFAFGAAFKGPDYLRVQLEKSRDFSLARSANQLLQSEGFYASFFYSFLMRGKTIADVDTVRERQNKTLRALASVFELYAVSAESPFLVNFVESYAKLYPGDAPDVMDVFLELSHGVFVDPQAAALWRDHYLGSLSLDMAERNNRKIADALSRWRNSGLKDMKILSSLLGPQIRCVVPVDSVKLVAFGETAPVSFDVNTVEEGIMRMIPQITDREVHRWLVERGTIPFRDAADFRNRSGLGGAVLNYLTF